MPAAASCDRRDQSTFPRGGQELLLLPDALAPARITRQVGCGRKAGFAAPELISSRQATRNTDIFAYVKTLQAVESRCEPDDGADMGQGQTAELISASTSREPESRPPAKDAMQGPFVAVLKGLRSLWITPQTCEFCKMNDDDAVYGADEGIRCSDGHFHCGSCLTRLTKDLLKVENQSQLAQREAQVMCFKYPCECKSPGFHAGDRF